MAKLNRSLRTSIVAKVFAVAVTAFMMMADMYTLRDLFIEMVNMQDAAIYSLILACALEGLPFYLGTISAERSDGGCYYRNDAKITKIGFWLTVIAITFAFTITVTLRIMWIYNLQLQGEFTGRRGFEDLIPQIFLTVSPLATSMLAFVASWFTFRSSYLEKAYKETVKKQEIYLQCEQDFRAAYDLYQGARTSLWVSLAESDLEQIPKGASAFRKTCFSRIRSKLVANCLIAYPTQIERYTQEVNSALERYIQEIERYTTVPQAIRKLTVTDLIERHDTQVMDYADCWNYNMAGPDLEAELRSTLDNAVVMAQFETASRTKIKRAE